MTGATSKCICGVQPPENDLTTIFVCYFLHVRSSVYPRRLFWKICTTRPQNFRGLKGKSTKKALLDVQFCVSFQLVQLQKYKESESAILTQIFSLK